MSGRRGWLVLPLAACVAGVAGAAPREVAVLPAHTFKGNPENGPVVTEAVRANLERGGYDVTPAPITEAALKKLKVDLSRPQFLPTLQALARELKVAYVVYPRIQGVGTGVNTDDREEFQATLIVNVAAPTGSSLYHVNQVGQVFRHPGKDAAGAVIDRQSAGQAASRLLEGFYKREKQAAARAGARPRPARAAPAARR